MTPELDLKAPKEHCFLFMFIIVCGLIYIFMAQFKLPCRADVFLYGMISGLGLLAIYSNCLVITKQAMLFMALDVVALVGCTYTTMEAEGWREFQLFTLFSGMFIFSFRNRAFIKMFNQCIYWGSVVVVFSVIVHFMFQSSFNSLMGAIMQPRVYELLMVSFNGNAFAGITGSTPNTTISAAIVLGNAFLGLANNEEAVVKNKTANLILLVVSLFSIILCSKRGLFVASIIGILVLMFYLYRGRKFWLRFIGLTLFAVTIFYILYYVNESVADFLDRFLQNENFTTGRDVIYESLLSRLNINNIWFGWGTGATYEIADTGAHNIYLQLLYDHGIVMSTPYYCFFIYNYCVAFINKHPVSVFIQTVFLIYGLSGNPLYSNIMVLMYVFQVVYGAQKPVNRFCA